MTEFERIYRDYFEDVYLYVKALSGSGQTAEEITSETFFKAMSAIDGFQGQCDIRVWLCQIAKNCYLSRLRKDKRLVFDAPAPETPDGLDVEQAVLQADTAMSIHEALHRLDEPYKEVFTLRVFGELPFGQIAALFQKTENWACVTYHRAKGKLKAQLEDQNENHL